ncbi:NAC domain-containing protein [Psidium guajava]|nr:NAC domain-containing protein [Psidium guajava]
MSAPVANSDRTKLPQFASLSSQPQESHYNHIQFDVTASNVDLNHHRARFTTVKVSLSNRVPASRFEVTTGI